MDSLVRKKYTNFDEFNKDSLEFLKMIQYKTMQLDEQQKIDYARKTLTKEILNSFIKIGHIGEDIVKLLESKSNILLFSMDNMIKNRLSHPEVTDQDYSKIATIIKNPSKYYKTKSEYDVVLFKEDNKYYKLVIKTTKNKKENYVKSLHLLNKERYNKY